MYHLESKYEALISESIASLIFYLDRYASLSNNYTQFANIKIFANAGVFDHAHLMLHFIEVFLWGFDALRKYLV